MINYMTCRWGG